MELQGVVGFDYRGARADRRPTGLVKEERYHPPFQLARGALASGASTFRSGCTIFMRTSRRGMRRCVTRSAVSSARRCSGSRTCGFGCRATRIKSVASRAIPPVSMTAFACRSSSGAGSLVADCPRPDLPYTRNPPRVVPARLYRRQPMAVRLVVEVTRQLGRGRTCPESRQIRHQPSATADLLRLVLHVVVQSVDTTGDFRTSTAARARHQPN
jgi:hypothetical protein